METLDQIPVGDIALNWQDINWGFRHRIYDIAVVIGYANRLTAQTNTSDPLVTALARCNATDYDGAVYILDKLAEKESISRKKCLYLVLLDLYGKRYELSNLFETLDAVYADFDYPEEMTAFVSYMPIVNSLDRELISRQDYVDNIFANWDLYLTATRLKYCG